MAVAPERIPEWGLSLNFPVSGEPLLKDYSHTDVNKFALEHNKTEENYKQMTKYAKCLHNTGKRELAKKFFREELVNSQDEVGMTVMVAAGLCHVMNEDDDLKKIFKNIEAARDIARTAGGAKLPTGNAANNWKKFNDKINESFTDDKVIIEVAILKQLMNIPDNEADWHNRIARAEAAVREEKEREIKKIRDENNENAKQREVTLENDRKTAVEQTKLRMDGIYAAKMEDIKKQIKAAEVKYEEELKKSTDRVTELETEVTQLRPKNEETRGSFEQQVNSNPKVIGWNIGESQTDKLIGLLSEAGSEKPIFNRITDGNRLRFQVPTSAFFSKANNWLGLDKTGERRVLAIFLLSGYCKEREIGELTGEITISKFNSFYGAKTVPNHYFEEAVTAAKSIRTLILKMGSPLIPCNYFRDYNLSETLKAFTHARSNPLTELVDLPKAIFVRSEAKVFEDSSNLKDIIEKLMVAIEIKEERVTKRSVEKAAAFARNLGLFLTGLDRDNTSRLISYVCYVVERGYELNGKSYNDTEDFLLTELNHLVKLAVSAENAKKETALKKTLAIKTGNDNTTAATTTTQAEGKGKKGKKGKGKASWPNSIAVANKDDANNTGKGGWYEHYNGYNKRTNNMKSEEEPPTKERKTETKGKGKKGGRELTEEERKLVNEGKSRLYDVASLNDEGGKKTKVRTYDNLMKVTRDGYCVPHQAMTKAAADGKLKNDGLAFGLCRDYHIGGKCDSYNCVNVRKFKHKINETEVKEMTNEEFDKKVAEYLMRVNC